MKKVFKVNEVCPSCGGTGIYVGLAEKRGAGVVCSICNGSGCKEFVHNYEEFEYRKFRDDITRVYLPCSYGLAPEVLNFEKIGEVDLTKEGVSYEEFLNGKMPDPIEQIECPMLADQCVCHSIDGFVDTCEDLNGGWIGLISSCKYQNHKSECWSRFHTAIAKE